MAKSGRANFLKLLFWTGVFKILAKTLMDRRHLSRILLDTNGLAGLRTVLV